MYRSTEDMDVYPTMGAVPSVRNMTHPTASDSLATPSPGSLNTPPVSGTMSPPDGRPLADPVVPPDTGSPPKTATVQGRPRGRRALVVAGACAAALAVWLLAGPVLGTDLTVRPAPGAAVVAGVLLVALPGSGAADAGRSRAGRTAVSTAGPVT